MSLNSVNTNVGAQVALQSLDTTNSALQGVQKQISTGFRVNDALDDGAAYAVAQGVRSNTAALTSANQQLGNAQGLISTTVAALNNVSNELTAMKAVLVKLSDASISSNTRTQYIAQYNTDKTAVTGYLQDADYNGRSLIGSLTTTGGQNGTTGSVTIVRNEVGQTYGISSFASAQAFITAISISSSITAGSAAAALQTTGFAVVQANLIGTELNKFGAANTYLNQQITYNSNKIDALNSGLGALVDADLAKESAQLQALQIRQQLGTQALTIANEAPSTLISLFKNA